jgi:hypothetical protein
MMPTPESPEPATHTAGGRTAAVALAFAPVRERSQALANRLVYGHRRSPYDVLADLGHRLAGTVSTEQLLPGWPGPRRPASELAPLRSGWSCPTVRIGERRDLARPG